MGQSSSRAKDPTRSPPPNSTSAVRARSDLIDRQIALDSKRYKKECKILLLGSGESGKSTIVKQMKIIHQEGFDERERREFRAIVYRNVLDSVRTLARVVRRVGVDAFAMVDMALGEGQRDGGGDGRVWAEMILDAFPAPADFDALYHGEDEASTVGHGSLDVGIDPIPWTRNDEERRPSAAEMILGRRPSSTDVVPADAAEVFAQTHAVLTPLLADAIHYIARHPVVEKVVDENPADFYLMDSATYFFSSIHRIAQATYVPSEEDVLRARLKSTAIIETRFMMGDLSIHMFDVGGQRSERKKWIHCFESVTSIIFCTALSEYDQVLEEERRVNRMHESLYLFESVINSRWFLRTSVILFLNKIDVFKRKLPKIPLGRYFPEYAGGNDLQKAAKYILWKFMQENRAKLTVYPHVTQATNTKNIRLVFVAVKETILQNALKDSGIL
ncbi:unnamed protein product [Mycena citricolor]|uniref:Uncharacterized protein n=1 Tax=Mycena citricolor TaxID=2018698 RepID=A0AAD2HQ43_9AGAR|nr:unnamed protein product [Mycena citricolor]